MVAYGGLAARLVGDLSRGAHAYDDRDNDMTDDPRLLLVWGKTQGVDPEATEGHPLLYHLIDVAVSAEVLWSALPSWMRRRIEDGVFGVRGDDARRAAALLAGLHDLGKASGFQAKVGPLWAGLRAAGLDIPCVVSTEPHAAVTAASSVLPELLLRPDHPCGIAAETLQKPLVVALAKAVGAHHGAFPFKNISDPAVLGGHAWASVRADLARRLTQVLYPGLPAVDLRGERIADPVAATLFTGFVAVADWIGSSKGHFKMAVGTSSEHHVEAYARKARAIAKAAMHHIGWLPVPRYASPQPFADIVWSRNDGHQIRFEPRGVQALVQEMVDALSGPYLLICEAAMGEGKTEAALYCVDRATTTGQARGAVVCMPTQATGNAMFDRVSDYLSARGHLGRINLQLVHGNAGFNETFASIRLLANGASGAPMPVGAVVAEDMPVAAEAWFTGSRQALLAPFGVGTIDQSLMAVLQTKHWFVRLFGLAGKVVVFDEVHAYDAYMNAILRRLIRWLSALDCTVVLLSATLPQSTRRELVEAYSPGVEPADAFYPRVTLVSRDGSADCRSAPVPGTRPRRTELAFGKADPSDVSRAIQLDLPEGGCAVVICNTVRNAQAMYAALTEALGRERWETELFHARTLLRWRREREAAVLDKLGKPGRAKQRPKRYVLIGTQVLEQSLDFDADWMASEFAPVDLLLQRMGRLWRHGRESRPVQTPRFTVLMSDGAQDETGCNDDLPQFPAGSDLVYDRYLLLRSYLALRGRDHVSLPMDIEPLVRGVYDEPQPEGLPEAWQNALRDAHVKMQKGEHDMKGVAQINLIPDWRKQNGNPKDFSTIYESTAHLDDGDDPAVHQSLRAQTRLGDPTATLVCVERLQDGRFVPVGGLTVAPELMAIDERTVAAAPVRELLLSSVSIARPKGLFRALLDQPVPEAWIKDRHLRYARLAVFENGTAQIGEFTLRLSPDTGLAIEKEEAA